eukprot:CAMPEP_0197444376 /NCGR_PEP_ID=MMETSP1175-20131217/9879_1 /TAXON_ID=1003142 /ORGANISM="Triceratium dubium, Strain CCMP147" /LENGTH=257 /DNA_ID=CAMNT_0042975155 /DNA_START=41 /DNA_END=813 /DNA_ORIENTATION=-
MTAERDSSYPPLLVAFLCATVADLDVPYDSGNNGGQSKQSLGAAFDFYVLAMSYQPEFCFEHRSEHFEGCRDPLEEWKYSLTIHGLWPQRDDGTWPSSCTDEPFDEEVLDDIGFEKFARLWPNVKADRRDEPGYTDFWAHEWSKHGTCSGLDQSTYFGTALDRAVPTPYLVKERYGAKIAKVDLLESYGGIGSVSLICERGHYLREARFCLQKHFNNTAGERMLPCPGTVLSEDNCMDEIFIAKFDLDIMKETHSSV